jgi:small multidrug resistance family-3 protein
MHSCAFVANGLHHQMKSILFFSLSALFEIVGCFAFWQWMRAGRSALWIVPGVASLMLFAWLLTQVDVSHAGRAYAIYGGIYIAASLLWLWAVEHQRPDHWDIVGALICLVGAAVIILPQRA